MLFEPEHQINAFDGGDGSDEPDAAVLLNMRADDGDAALWLGQMVARATNAAR